MFPLLRRILIACPLLLGFASSQPFIEKELRIPAPAAGAKWLQALLIRPNEPGPHPLVLINHGSPRDTNARSEMHPYSEWMQAMEFARRGWAAVVVMRRGYGESGGDVAEGLGPCNHPGYVRAGEASASDLRAAIDYLSRLPEIDARRIVSVGVSAGGFATVALTADPPRGLVAAISFAGGRGSGSADQVCSADELVDAFSSFGKRSRIPMLWVYAENDHFFGPQLAQRFYKAFTLAGGSAVFIAAPAFGDEGHTLFSKNGIPVWTPLVDDFLRRQKLALRATPLPFPVPDIQPPRQLNAKGREAFNSYLRAAPHKAFAVSPGGGYAWVSTRPTAERAQEDAMDNCRKSAKAACTVFIVDHGRRN
jgi:dienelactone hydrolase